MKTQEVRNRHHKEGPHWKRLGVSPEAMRINEDVIGDEWKDNHEYL